MIKSVVVTRRKKVHMFTVKVYSLFHTLKAQEPALEENSGVINADTVVPNKDNWNSRVHMFQAKNISFETYKPDKKPETIWLNGSNGDEIQDIVFCAEIIKGNNGEWCNAHKGEESYVWQIIIENMSGQTTQIIRTDNI